MAVSVYVLSKERTLAYAEKFLDTFLPSRAPVAAEPYEVPQYASNPRATYCDWKDLVRELEFMPTEDYSIYWNAASEAGPRVLQAILWFTDDGGLVAGTVVPADAAVETLCKMTSILQGSFGYVTGDEPPPLQKSGFERVCRAADMPRYVDGKLIASSVE